ncbi:post-transcriptional regulator [Alteribacillus persepolensis]|nr:post-transcriptional regulator [Alteribacillus persepolensis]
MSNQQFDVWKEDAWPALKSKVEEFHLLGYHHADEEAVWDCVVEKLRKKKDYVRFHVVINMILTLRLSEYMNRLTIQSYKESSSDTSDLHALIDDIDNHSSSKRHLT